VLHLSTNHPTALSDHPGLQYFIGDFDGSTFSNDNPAATVLTPDYGRDNYAAVTWSDIPVADGRRLIIGWMNDWTYARGVPTDLWGGQMTIPRVLRLRQYGEEIRLIQTPVVELERLRAGHIHREGTTIGPASSVWERSVSEAMEIIAVIAPGSASEFGIRVHAGEGEQTTIGYDSSAGVLFVDRSRSGRTDFSPAFPGRYGGPLVPVGGLIALRIFLDCSSVEVFGNEGEAVISSLIFPESTTASLECYAVGGDVRLTALDIYQLQL